MNVLSVCSGIEAASAAWRPLGFESVAFSEIDKFPCAVLAHHYPEVPNWGDLTKFEAWPDADIDLLVGGTPCQSFSVAGLREGLDDPRGSLMLTYLAVARKYRPRWLVWENVPGVLSSDDGRAFGSLLGGLAELGYGFAYRILDAQYFGLAQRRKRVFVVAHSGDWRRAAAVLFEPESLSGHPAPRREAGERTAPCLKGRAGRSGANNFATSGGLVDVAGALGAGDGSRGWRNDLDQGAFIPVANSLNGNAGRNHIEQSYVPEISLCLNAGAMGRIDAESETLVPIAHALDSFSAGRATEDGTGRGCPLVPVALFDERTVTSPDNRQSCAVNGAAPTMHTTPFTIAASIGQRMRGQDDSCADNLQVASSMQVRRLTPRECERLQGFSDDYTLIPYRGKPAADGPRYKALGNSMAVPVMAWIGKRIAMVDAL